LITYVVGLSSVPIKSVLVFCNRFILWNRFVLWFRESGYLCPARRATYLDEGRNAIPFVIAVGAFYPDSFQFDGFFFGHNPSILIVVISIITYCYEIFSLLFTHPVNLVNALRLVRYAVMVLHSTLPFW
jgi:hypothetical protein